MKTDSTTTTTFQKEGELLALLLLRPEGFDLAAAAAAAAMEERTPAAWIKAARSCGLSVRKSHKGKMRGQTLYLKDRAAILYDPRQSTEDVCRGFRKAIKRHLKTINR